ncbi:MAG: HAMP domain-containing histidine kinase [Flavobacterium sp.]|nr:HAMP domain-containing histidine kinase [Flavobacterium sp.]
MLPVLIEKEVYKNINKSLLEKKEKFICNLDKQEINDFIVRNDATETYSSFSTLHSEFLQLSRLPKNAQINKMIFIAEPRIIEEERNDYMILQYDFIYEKTAYRLEIGNSLSEIKELTFTLRLFILIVLFIILALTFLMDSFFIEYLLKPFNRIIDTKIRRVNEPDTFDHTPIQTHSTDFQELDTVLNQMMDRISELFNKERQFIANVSHELLTPVALLKNKFENLLQNDSLDDNAIDKIASSLRTLDMLKKVINNLLLISRIENHQYEANESIDLKELINNLLEDLNDRMEEKGLILTLNLQHNFPFIGNKTLIHILLYNLLVNAIKYNRKNGNITICDGFLKEKYYLSISDTGIGMIDSQINQIFNRFARINTDQEGQGLGLAIVDSIAHFHQIDIEVTSIPNEGTTFTLLLSNHRKLK